MKIYQLELIANGAIPGPWEYQENGIAYVRTVEAIHGPDADLRERITEYISKDNGQFIATFNPDLVLKLLAVVREHKQLLQDLEDLGSSYTKGQALKTLENRQEE